MAPGMEAIISELVVVYNDIGGGSGKGREEPVGEHDTLCIL